MAPDSDEYMPDENDSDSDDTALDGSSSPKPTSLESPSARFYQSPIKKPLPPSLAQWRPHSHTTRREHNPPSTPNDSDSDAPLLGRRLEHTYGPTRKKIKSTDKNIARPAAEGRHFRKTVQTPGDDKATATAITISMDERSNVNDEMRLKLEAHETHIEVLRNRCLDFLSDFAKLRGWLQSQKNYDSKYAVRPHGIMKIYDLIWQLDAPAWDKEILAQDQVFPKDLGVRGRSTQ
ncbi:hypothetical protein K491DRAFT_697903 [Lophiostoma macrostomum CBS 122681]|uniref:Uncharacterized protein n=1 Tax=Lophiostoma macrostomum CBS 122681 TaxID=1314788 RepID=A0A6A6SRQ4_9PLEO|nr:hypothetical protein K491DRAFT_697903 [Lophiostoma macrostomum CBS 122681]